MVPHAAVRAFGQFCRARHPALAACVVAAALISCQGERHEGFAPPASEAALPADTAVSESLSTAAAAQPIAGLTLTPTSATLAPGASVTFTPLGWLPGANTPIPTPVSWTATGGTITSGGVYTAGSQTGTFMVTATSTIAWKYENATITIKGTGTPATITGLTLSPGSVSLAPGGKQQFSASASLSNGSTQPNPAVTWQATGGSVSSGGMYTAGTTAGSYRVIATTSNGKADTSSVQVSQSAPTVSGVTLSPGSVTLAAGATQTFTASARMSDGSNQSNPSLTWSATGGSINSSHVYTAGSSAGNYRVIASSSNGKADTSNVTVTVSGGGDPTPPPPSGAGEPTPSGKIIRSDNFDSYSGSRPGSPWDCTPGASDVQMISGRSGKAFRLVYTPSNFYSGCDLQFSTTSRIAVSYWFRISPTGYNIIEGDNTGSGMKWFTLWRPTAPRQTWGANQLGGVSAPTFGTHDNSSSNMPNPVNGPSGLWNKVNDGQWHRYTIVAVTGSSGYEQCWLDGTKIFDTQGRGYNRSSEGFNLLQIGHDKVRAPLGTRYLDIDDFAAWVP